MHLINCAIKNVGICIDKWALCLLQDLAEVNADLWFK